jgi:galactokinase
MTEQTTQTAYNTLTRGDGETFAEYKARRAAANKAVKALKRGVLFHDSNELGTFINWDKQRLKAQRAARKAQRKAKQ